MPISGKNSRKKSGECGAISFNLNEHSQLILSMTMLSIKNHYPKIMVFDIKAKPSQIIMLGKVRF